MHVLQGLQLLERMEQAPRPHPHTHAGQGGAALACVDQHSA